MAFTLEQIQRGALRSRRNRIARYTRAAVTPPRHLQPGPQDRLETVALWLRVNAQTLAWPANIPAADQTGDAVYTVPVGSVFVVQAVALCVFNPSAPYEGIIEFGGQTIAAKGSGLVTDTLATPTRLAGAVYSRALSRPLPLPAPISVYGNGRIALGARRWFTSPAQLFGLQYEPRIVIAATVAGFLAVADGEVYP